MNIRKVFKASFLSLICLVLSASAANAVMIASDFFNFYLDGKLVNTGPIIIKNPSNYFYHSFEADYSMQQSSSPGTYTFFLLGDYDVENDETGVNKQKDKTLSNASATYPYQVHLKMKTVKATASATVCIPSPSEMPALEKSPDYTPPPGMTGGKIGDDRFFKVILNENIIEQISRRDFIFH